MSILTNDERAELGLPMDYSTVSCGCFACDEQVQPGHFVCEAPPDWALELERAGKIARRYGHPADDRFAAQRWFWEAV